jgi:hypothetical protein
MVKKASFAPFFLLSVQRHSGAVFPFRGPFLAGSGIHLWR